LGIITLLFFLAVTANAQDTFPAEHWEIRLPAEAGLDAAKLDAVREFMGGRGCVVRNGYLVYEWGDISKPYDVASALKPWITHFLFVAVEEGLLPSVDARVVEYAPCLNDLNPGLDHKDRQMTFWHMANQISCYGVRESPGTAFDYNDWQMALFWDTLFLNVYGADMETVDNTVLRSRLTDKIQCEDNPTFLAFGPGERAGRFTISPRDFARFGLLYLHGGNWNGKQVISREHVAQITTSPLPNTIPRTAGEEAEMCPGQRSIGSQKVPDNQTPHEGSYSWLWWVNGVNGDGERLWPDAPHDVFAALGHKNGMRGMAVFPALGIVVSWNDTNLGDMPEKPEPLNTVFHLIGEAAAE
jgi:CubicO group peptidase (beta-lactamase class C family)